MMVYQVRTWTEFRLAVAKARKHAGLTQVDMAEKLGCTSFQISRLERGKRRPSMSFMLEVVRVLGIEVLLAPGVQSGLEDQQCQPGP